MLPKYTLSTGRAARLVRHLCVAWVAALTAAGPVAAAPGPAPSAPSVGLPSVARQCERLYAPGWRPSTVPVRTPATPEPRPAKGLPVVDAAHRTCVVRVTDHDAELRSGFARQEYSRRQAFNADDSRLIVVAQDGHWHLYDAADLSHLGKLPGLGGDAEPQWHPTDPHLLRFLPNNGVGMTLHELDLRTGRTRVLADLGSRVRAVWPKAQALWTRSEGSPSRDHRFWAFQVDDAQWAGVGLVSYDLEQDRIIATYDLTEHRKGRPDHISMSPTGRHIVVSWLDAVTAFQPDFTRPRVIHGKSEHSDLALDAAGDDVYVSIDYAASGGPLFAVNLRTGRRTELLKTYIDGTATALHVSGKAFGRPGWVVVSTYADYGKAGPQWLHRKVFALSLDPSPRMVNLAHHHSHYDAYFTEPHASTNRTLTRVLFNSNWGTRSKTDIDTFMVVVPESVFRPSP